MHSSHTLGDAYATHRRKSVPAGINEPSFDLDNAIKECSKELIQIPGFIQPNGVLLCVEKLSLAICQASSNVEDILGVSLDAVLGRGGFAPATLSSILGLDQDGLDALSSDNFIEFTLPTKAGQFIAFASRVPTSTKSYQWFDPTTTIT